MTSASPSKPILVLIDDDEALRAALAFTLRQHYEVRACGSAVEGVDAVDGGVAVVVLDIKMQGHDGFWAYQAIRTKNSIVPIIFNTAYQDLKDPYEIINEYRPFGYVSKGADVQLLLRTIANAVSYSQRYQEHSRVLEELRRLQREVDDLRNTKK